MEQGSLRARPAPAGPTLRDPAPHLLAPPLDRTNKKLRRNRPRCGGRCRQCLAREWQARPEDWVEGACALGSAPRASRRSLAGRGRPGRWRRWGGRAGAGRPGGRGGATLQPRVPLPWPPPAPGAAPSPPGRAPGPRTDGPWRRPPLASPCSLPPRSRWRPGPRPALASAPDPVSERSPTPALRGTSPRGQPGGYSPLATTLRDSFPKPLSDAPQVRAVSCLKT